MDWVWKDDFIFYYFFKDTQLCCKTFHIIIGLTKKYKIKFFKYKTTNTKLCCSYKIMLQNLSYTCW